MTTMTGESGCVQIRARVRRSSRWIDPEFTDSAEALVSFVDEHDGGGPAIVLTPVPAALPRSRSMGRVQIATPMKRRQRSMDPALPPSSDAAAESGGRRRPSPSGSVGSDGMVEVSLDEDPADGSISSGLQRHRSPHPLRAAALDRHSKLPPAGPLPSGVRHPSPHGLCDRTPSGVSSAAGGSDADARSSGRSAARSRSRSSSRRRVSHMRNRSASAASAFRSGSPSSRRHSEDADGSLNGSFHGRSCVAAAEEPTVIPLGDILSVDEEVPRTGGGLDGGGDGRSFFSSAASDAGAADTPCSGPGVSPAPTPRTGPPPPPTRAMYRIFVRTASSYVEFSLDTPNGHDIFMAHLKAHLDPERIPTRGAGDGAGGTASGGAASGAMRTVVMTPSKGPAVAASVAAGPAPSGAAGPGRGPRPPTLSRVDSAATHSSVNIEKLHAAAVRRRLRAESTPLSRLRDSLAGWASTVVDCACCSVAVVGEDDDGDGTAATEDAGTAEAGPGGGKGGTRRRAGPSPDTERLRSRGIGGLSFEEISICGTPRLSFEGSASADGSRGQSR